MAMRPVTQEDLCEMIDIWQYVRQRMNEYRVTPEELAQRIGLSEEYVRQSVRGEPRAFRPYLRRLVDAFGLTSGRAGPGIRTADNLSDDECIQLLKPPPGMPHPKDFWDDPDSDEDR